MGWFCALLALTQWPPGRAGNWPSEELVLGPDLAPERPAWRGSRSRVGGGLPWPLSPRVWQALPRSCFLTSTDPAFLLPAGIPAAAGLPTAVSHSPRPRTD